LTEQLAEFSIWVGGIIGLLKVVDWLLSERQKQAITAASEHAWIWLSDQRAGKYIELIRNKKIQVGFVLFAHISLIVIALLFLFRVFLSIPINAYLELGHPRIYRFQVLIDIFSLCVSMFLVAKYIHPRASAHISDASSVIRSLGRTAKLLGLCILVAFVLLIAQYPVIGFDSPFFTLDDPQQIKLAYENMFGGQLVVVLIHAVSSLVTAPVLVEWIILQSILFLSVYWLIFVVLLIALFSILKFILIRIVESKNGPVLALSGLLIGLGAIAKAIAQ